MMITIPKDNFITILFSNKTNFRARRFGESHIIFFSSIITQKPLPDSLFELLFKKEVATKKTKSSKPEWPSSVCSSVPAVAFQTRTILL